MENVTLRRDEPREVRGALFADGLAAANGVFWSEFDP
jgi:hypothetical protein